MNDMLFHLTEWLRTTFMVNFSLWISDTSLSNVLVTHFWIIPIMQCIHILSIAASFSSVLMIALRVFNLAGHATLAETSRRYSRVLWWALVFLIISGLGMITAEPVRELVNPYFWVKMVLVVIAILFSIYYAGSLKRQLVATSDGMVVETVGGSARVGAVFLVILWCMIMWCGRWIAYAPV